MAELLKDNAGLAVVPATPRQDGYALTITEYDADSATPKTMTVSIPTNATLDTIKGNLLLRAAILKSTTWKAFKMPQIMHAIMFADRLGLDIELGDVYSTDGRPAINAEGRIKLAQKDPRYRGSKTTFRDTGTALNKPKCVLKTDLECTVEVYVDGWQAPIRRTALLSRWYRDTSAWNERPEHQLEMNTIGHACRFLRPVGDPEDAPPAPEPDLIPALQQSVAATSKGGQ